MDGGMIARSLMDFGVLLEDDVAARHLEQMEYGHSVVWAMARACVGVDCWVGCRRNLQRCSCLH
jgi:hypothetical protein